MCGDFITVFLYGVNGQNFTCPEADGICLIGTYPDPDSCSYFYDCSQDVVSGCVQVRHQCPPGYAFDRIYLLCAIAEDSGCSSKSLFKSLINSRHQLIVLPNQIKRLDVMKVALSNV